MVTTISFLEENKRTKQYEVRKQIKPTSGAVTEIIEVDPRKDVIVQINSEGNTYDIEVTSHTGTGNTDLEDAAVPWILFRDDITVDFHTGSGLVNKGLVGVKITVASVATSFELFVAQQA